MLLTSVREAIIEHTMLRSGQRVLVAVSGGLDSIVLLDALHQLTPDLDLTLAVGHVNHGTRGEASDRDAAFVESIATMYELPFAGHVIPEEAWEPHRQLGYEASARAIRYEALERMASELDMDRIALAHTLNDQAETLLYRLARGTGPTGLVGIPAVRGPYIRPLLSVPRIDIEAYARERTLAWREDESNRDLSIARNRIRHRVIPELEAINPRVLNSLQRASHLIHDQLEVCSPLIRKTLDDLTLSETATELRLDRERLARLPSAHQRLLLRAAIEAVRGHLRGVDCDHIDALVRWAPSDRLHGSLSFPGLHIRIQGEQLILSMNATSAATEPPNWTVPLSLGLNELPILEATLELSIVPRDAIDLDDLRTCRWTEGVDADRLAFPLSARSRQSGDRFQPIGATHSAKLKEFLINHHVPHERRNHVPLVCDRYRILWVAGYRLSDCVKITASTQRVLLMRMKGLES